MPGLRPDQTGLARARFNNCQDRCDTRWDCCESRLSLCLSSVHFVCVCERAPGFAEPRRRRKFWRHALAYAASSSLYSSLNVTKRSINRLQSPGVVRDVSGLSLPVRQLEAQDDSQQMVNLGSALYNARRQSSLDSIRSVANLDYQGRYPWKCCLQVRHELVFSLSLHARGNTSSTKLAERILYIRPSVLQEHPPAGIRVELTLAHDRLPNAPVQP